MSGLNLWENVMVGPVEKVSPLSLTLCLPLSLATSLNRSLTISDYLSFSFSCYIYLSLYLTLSLWLSVPINLYSCLSQYFLSLHSFWTYFWTYWQINRLNWCSWFQSLFLFLRFESITVSFLNTNNYTFSFNLSHQFSRAAGANLIKLFWTRFDSAPKFRL